MKNGSKRRILALMAALLISAYGLHGMDALAEETAAQAPAAAEAPKENSASESRESSSAAEPKENETASEPKENEANSEATERPAAETTPAPEEEEESSAEPAPTVSAVPDDVPAPETSAVPDDAPTPEASAVPDEGPALAPGEILEVLPTEIPEAESDEISAAEADSGETSSFELLKKSRSSRYNHLNLCQMTIPEDGMPIPLIYQSSYGRAVCIAGGSYKSVATSGCGATAASMVIAYLTQNEDQTPYTLFYWAAAHGRYRGSGLGMESVQEMLSNYGVSSRMEGVNAERIIGVLKEDRPIIMLMGPGTFTKNGHYIVLRGLDEAGRVLVNDPASASRSKGAYSVELIVREAKGGVMLVTSAGKAADEAQEGSAEANAVEATPTPADDLATTATPTLADVLAATATPAPQISADASDAQSAYTAQVCVDCVNLRTEIGNSGKIAAQIGKGERVQVVEERTMASGNVWCKVIYEGQELYMRGDMLEKIS